MKKLLIVFTLLFSLKLIAQSPAKIGDTVFVNKFGTISIHKMGSPIKSFDYEKGFSFVIISNYARYGYDLMNNFKIVTNHNDTGWVMIKSLERSFEDGLCFTPSKYNELKNKYSNIFYKLMNGEYWIGMKEDELMIAIGKPTKINTTITANKISKQLVYGESDANYFYTENGILTTVQQ